MSANGVREFRIVGSFHGDHMEMFNRHNEIRRTVEEIPGGVRTTTESDAAELAAQLHAHVPAMYARVEAGSEIMCMSASLPTLFGHATDYRRQLTLTPKGRQDDLSEHELKGLLVLKEAQSLPKSTERQCIVTRCSPKRLRPGCKPDPICIRRQRLHTPA